MQKFSFDLQRFSVSFEFTYGTKTFDDRGEIGNGTTEYTYWDEEQQCNLTGYKPYVIYQYYPSQTWNDYFQFQNYKSIKLTAINEYRYDSEGNGWQNWQETVSGETFSGDYRILRGGNSQYHALENHQASYVKMYGRNDGCVLHNNGGSNALMVGGSGNDYITNSGNFVTIAGGAGNDYIDNLGSAFINGGANDDTITNSGSSVQIIAGSGADHVKNSGSDVEIDAGTGADHIINNGNGVTIDAGNDESNDEIENSGSHVEISTGAGMDLITNRGSSMEINAGVGNDLVRNEKASNVVINAEEGDDEIINDGTNVKIFAGKNNDHIENSGVKVTIDAGNDAGSDNITNSGSSVQIIAGSGADYVKNSGSDVEIDAGADSSNDHVENSGSNVRISSAAGNNLITNSGSSVTINSGVGDDEIHNTGSTNVIINAGNGQNQITNEGNSVEITSGENADRVENNGLDVTIDSGAGDDTVENSAAGAEITSGAGDDNVYNAMQASETTIKTGSDDDTITNGADEVKIDSGSEDDKITNTGHSVTIDGGTGDDTIVSEGAGNVSINAGNGKNLVSVTGQNYFNTIEGGDDREGIDVIFNGTAHAVIKGNGGLNIVRNSGKYALVYGGNDCDQLFNYGNNALIKGGGGTDYIYSNRAEKITLDGGDASDTIEVYHDVEASVCGGAGNDNIFVGRVSAEDVQALGAYMTIDFVNAVLSLISVPATFSPFARDWLLAIAGFAFRNLTFVGTGLNVISGALTILDKLSPDSLLNKLNYSESTVNGGAGNDVIVLDGFAPRVVEYSNGDGNDVVHYLATNRATYESSGNTTAATHLSTLHIKQGQIDTVTTDGNDIIFKIGGGSTRLVNAAGFRFKVREADGTLTTRIYGTNKGEIISSYSDNPESNLIIDGMGGNDRIYNHAHDSTIRGGDGNDIIYNNGSVSYRVRLNGDAGNDIIYGSSGHYLVKNVTVNGGIGDDKIDLTDVDNALVEYSEGDGNDIVYNFGRDDTLKISALSYTTERKGFDLIVHVGTGSINLKGCRFLGKVNIDGTPENNLVNAEFYDMQLDGDKLSLLKLNPGEILNVNEAEHEITIVDASKSQTSVKVIGNISVNKFIGSDSDDVFYSEPPATKNLFASQDIASNDDAEVSAVTIDAGKGNDTVYGGDRPNLYVYSAGDGRDVIYNVGAADMLSITGGKYSSVKSGNDILVTVGEGSVVLKDAASLSTVNILGKLIEESPPVDEKIIQGTAKAEKLNNTVEGATIQAQGGNDTVTNSGANSSIDGSAGNDKITNTATNVTVTGGTGSDTVTLSGGSSGGNIFVYSAGDGKDVVYKFQNNDTIKVADNSTLSPSIKGKDVILTLDKNNFVTLKDAADGLGKKVTLVDANDEIISAATYSTLGVARDDSIKLASSFKGTISLDMFKTIDASDVSTLNLSLDGKKITNVEVDGKTINLEFNNSETLTLENLKNNTVTIGKTACKFTDGGIMNAAETSVTLNASTKNFTADSKLATIDAGLTSNATISGNSKANKISFGDGENVFVWTGGNDTLTNFGDGDLISVTGAVTDGTVSKGTSVLTVGKNKITVKDSSQITFADSSGTKIFSGGAFTDEEKISATLTSATKDFDASKTTFTSITGNAKANKLTSNATGATLTGGKGNDTFVTAGGEDFITDYGNGSDKISLSSSLEDFSVAGDDVSLDLVKGSVTIANGAGKKISLVSGGKTTANIFTADGLSNSAGTAVTLNASTKNFTADSKLVTIDASLTSNATIAGNSKANKISFGDGENVFVWTGGNDTLTNFGDGDLISVTGAVTDGTVSKGTSVLTVGKNKITVKDSSTVTFTDNEGTKIFDDGIFFDADKTSVTLTSATKDFDASKTTFTSITGNTKANKIHAGDFDSTIDGGKGNDSLWGGSGSDIFTYTANTGTDKIFGFGDDDMLQILNANGSAASFTNSTFANNSLTLTVKGGGKIIFDGVTSASTFNINGDIYHISGKTIAK